MFHCDTMECVPVLTSCRCHIAAVFLCVSTFRGFVCMRACCSFNSICFRYHGNLSHVRNKIPACLDTGAGFLKMRLSIYQYYNMTPRLSGQNCRFPLPFNRPFPNFFKVYMTDFFLFARLNLPNVLISVAKQFFR